jgi:hypothetical protein
MQVNWKIKCMFYIVGRLFILVVYHFRFGVSFIFASNTHLCITVACLILYDAEKTLMEVYLEKEVNRKEKEKWSTILNNLPIFVTIYDKVTHQIKHLNHHFKRTFGITSFTDDMVIRSIKQPQNMKIKDKSSHIQLLNSESAQIKK